MKKIIILVFIAVLGFAVYFNFNKKNINNSSKEYIHDFFNTTEYDKTKFNGIVYDKNNNQYNLNSLINGKSISLKNRYSTYFFTKNISKEEEILNTGSLSESVSLDKSFLVDVLGNPSTIFELYEDREYDGIIVSVGKGSLIYVYDDFIIEVLIWDFRNLPNKDLKDLSYYGINAYDKEYFNQYIYSTFSNYDRYGNEL